LIGFYKYNAEVAWFGIRTKFRGKEFTKCLRTKDPKKISHFVAIQKELFVGKALEELHHASSITVLVFIDSE